MRNVGKISTWTHNLNGLGSVSCEIPCGTGVALGPAMLSSLPYSKKNLGAPLQSRKAMLETLFRHLDMVRLSVGAILVLTLVSCTGLIDGGSDGLSPQQRTAAKLWKESA